MNYNSYYESKQAEVIPSECRKNPPADLKIGPQAISKGNIIAAGIFVSSLTLPYVWFIFPWLTPSFVVAIWVAEIFVVIAAAIFYKLFIKLSLRSAFLISLIANLASRAIDQLLHRIHS